ncbi:MAG: heavy metal translocating P-type ATPase [Thalassobaculum sp.]|uniref:heavy metal translocating P-type ATPase n=2 Tax=Thalassobaculum sp. TaxID=2022740 RepID=UPI0032EB6DB3
MTVETSQALRLRVEGMDCGACALKIENGLKRLPGVSDISVNFAQEALSLVFDEDRTSRGAIEGRIRSLGYTPLSTPGDEAVGSATHLLRAGRETRRWWETRKGQLVLATGGLLALAFGVSLLEPGLSEWAYLAAAVVGLVPIMRRAVTGAMHGTPFSIETLMSVAAIGAIAIGEGAEAAIVVFLFAVGELLENAAAGRAGAGIAALIDLVPRIARVARDGDVREIPVEELAVDDEVIVRPGDRVPSDGVVLDGVSEVDEAPVTGESVPVTKEAGASVYAGSINANGVLRVRITRTAADNTIARIIHLVEEAQGSKAPTARFIDRFSTWYTPAAMAVSGAIMVVPPLLFGADWTTWVYRGLATLLIACPCALVISTPAAIASGLAAGARRGLLIKGGAALELLGKVRTVAFDKTGTLTVGRPRVTEVVPVGVDEAEVLAKAAAVERDSSHPIGIAIAEAAAARNIELPKVFGGAVAIPGKAVRARLQGGFVSVGSPRYAAEHADLPEELGDRCRALEADGKTVVTVIHGRRVIGLIGLRDQPREDAQAGVAALNGLGIRTVMLTGDNRRTAAAIAAGLGLEAKAELLPDAKLAEIAKLRSHGGVAMVGDGINDAPALAAASVGIAMGGGTDVALETADAALLKNRVQGVAEMVGLSRATLTNIWQNIALALGLKGIFLVTTVTGTTTLWMAILADTGATVLVTMNALRLLRFDASRTAGRGAAHVPPKAFTSKREA